MTSPLLFTFCGSRLGGLCAGCALTLGLGLAGRGGGREDLLEGAAAGLCVTRPPGVAGAGRTVHGALHVPEVRRLVAARSVAAPPVLATRVHLIVECVIDGDVGVRCGLCGKASPTRLVDAAHVLLELIAVIIAIEVVARDK